MKTPDISPPQVIHLQQINLRLWLPICLLLFTSGFAQPLREVVDSTRTSPSDFPFSIYLTLGIPGSALMRDIESNPISDQLESQGIEVPNTTFLYNFGLEARWRRLYGGIQVNRQFFTRPYFQSLNRDEQIAVDREFESIGVHLGYAIWQNRLNELQLWIGVGSATTNISLNQPPTATSYDLGDLEPVPNASSWPIFSHTNFYGDVALGWQRGHPRRPASLTEIIRVGYRSGLRPDPWEALGYSNVNVPTSRLGQIYLNISFQIGFNFPAKR